LFSFTWTGHDTSPVQSASSFLTVRIDAGNPVHHGDARFLSPTDPAAAWNTKEGWGKFGYFSNYLVDTDRAIIIDVEATPARIAREIRATKTMLGRVNETHGLQPQQLTADKAYGTGPFLEWLWDRKIIPHIPVLDRQHQTGGLLRREAFTIPRNNYYICPQGKILKHRTARTETHIHTYRSTASDCQSFPSGHDVRGERNALYLYHSTRMPVSMPWRFRTLMRTDNRAGHERKWRCCLPT
jgi:hypothetical protein